MLNKVKIVLVQTSHPGNIGAAARAMKTMGLSELVLVGPLDFPSDKATARASGADDVLDKALVTHSLDEAIADCQLVIGASARSRSLDWPMLDPRQATEKLIASVQQQQQVAILFGRERDGLSNEELQRCNYHVCIPANPEYSSLNLGAAVQVLAYECRMAMLGLQNKAPESEVHAMVEHREMERFYQHLETSLRDIKFLNPEQPKQLMPRLRRLFNRAQPNQQEMNILRGILTAIDRKGTM